MGKSNARKKREKLVREHKLDPSKMRSAFATRDGFNFLATKKTKTKKEKLEKESKFKKNLFDFE